jgi:hypothetical protein
MEANALYRAGSVVITSASARFGDATFQISDIKSVRLTSRRKVTPAGYLVLLCVMAFFLATGGYDRKIHLPLTVFAALAALVAFFVVLIRPGPQGPAVYKLRIETSGLNSYDYRMMDAAEATRSRMRWTPRSHHAFWCQRVKPERSPRPSRT